MALTSVINDAWCAHETTFHVIWLLCKSNVIGKLSFVKWRICFQSYALLSRANGVSPDLPSMQTRGAPVMVLFIPEASAFATSAAATVCRIH